MPAKKRKQKQQSGKLTGKAKRGGGRPRNDDDFLAMEVHEFKRAYGFGVRKACKWIAKGLEAELRPRKGMRRKVRGSRWKGKNAGTLEQRYFRWLRREEERLNKADRERTMTFLQWKPTA